MIGRSSSVIKGLRFSTSTAYSIARQLYSHLVDNPKLNAQIRLPHRAAARSDGSWVVLLPTTNKATEEAEHAGILKPGRLGNFAFGHPGNRGSD